MWSSLQLSHRLYKLNWFTLTSEMMWHLECGTDFEVNRNYKKNCPILWQMDHKNMEGRHRVTPDVAMLRLHISCTMRANGTLQSEEMWNFSAAECGTAIRGNLWNVPHLIFRKLPLDNFLHFAIRIPQNNCARPSHIDNDGTVARGVSTFRCPVICPVIPSLFRPTGMWNMYQATGNYQTGVPRNLRESTFQWEFPGETCQSEVLNSTSFNGCRCPCLYNTYVKLRFTYFVHWSITSSSQVGREMVFHILVRMVA